MIKHIGLCLLLLLPFAGIAQQAPAKKTVPSAAPGTAGKSVPKQTGFASPEAMLDAFVRAYNTRQARALAACYSPQAEVIQGPDGPRPYRGQDTIRMMYAGYFQFVPNMQIKLKEKLIKGKTVILKFDVTGVFQSPPPGYDASVTTARFSTETIAWMELDASHRIRKATFSWDLLSMLNQAGWRDIIPGR